MNNLKWKNISGFRGKYLISNNGDVFSIKRNRIMKNLYSREYFFIGLHKNGKSKTFFIHKLVALPFFLS